MAKSVGFPATVAVDSSDGTPRTISNDITNFTMSTPRGVQDVTGVNASAMERLLLLADFSVAFNGIWSPGANPSSHGVFATVPSTSVTRTTTITFTTPVLAVEVLYTDYQLTRAQDGSLVWSAPGVLNASAAPTTPPTWA